MGKCSDLCGSVCYFFISLPCFGDAWTRLWLNAPALPDSIRGEPTPRQERFGASAQSSPCSGSCHGGEIKDTYVTSRVASEGKEEPADMT